jgi:hypothetical protein
VPLIKHIMACQHEEVRWGWIISAWLSLSTFDDDLLATQVHCASWPHLHDNMPHHSLSRTANVGSNRAYAIEVGTFVIMATAPISEQNAQHLCGDDQTKRENLGMGGGCSMIYDPEGREIAEPLDEHAEGIVYATVDPVKCSLAKAALDTVGHYAREDVFRVTFDAEPRQSVKLHTSDPRTDQRFRISRTEMFSTATKRLGESAGAASVIRP